MQKVSISLQVLSCYNESSKDRGKAVRRNIIEVDGNWQFRLGAGDRCPFLREDADFIYLHYHLTGQLAESARRWSEQIEYSTGNVKILMGLLV